jgi:hypothetical protein
VLATKSVSLNSGTSYTVLAVEPSFASTSLNMTLLTDDNSAPASGDFNLRITNASPDFGNLDAYVTAPGAGISGATPSVTSLASRALPRAGILTLPSPPSRYTRKLRALRCNRKCTLHLDCLFPASLHSELKLYAT